MPIFAYLCYIIRAHKKSPFYVLSSGGSLYLHYSEKDIERQDTEREFVTGTSCYPYIKDKDRRDVSMAIVKTIEHGACTVYIHDDAVVHTAEEKQQIIDNVSRIVINALYQKETAVS
jgi:hypothetical protein